MMRFATRKNSISWIQCLTVSIQNELRHRLLMLFSCVFAMLASHATFAQEAGVGPAVPPEQSWKATTQLYCDFNTTRVFQSNWPGDSPVAVIEAYVAKLNELCSGGAGANHTVTYTLNPCTPTLTVSGNGTNPLALAIASGCTIQEVAVPKPSCTPAPCANPFWNNIRTAPAPSKVCASWAEGNGSRYTLAGSTYGECKCPKGSKFNSAVGKCLGEVDQTQKQQCSLQAGNPIYPGTGNKRQEETDYVGTGPAPLTFRRIYNSGTSFGRTWKTNYDQTINFYGANGTPTATVNRSEGSFSYSYVAGNWVADGDVKMALYGSNGGFTVISADGRRVETYNAQNKLTRIATRSSGTLYTLVYSTTSTPVSIAPTAGLLIQVSDAFGHSLTLTYDAQQRLGTMRDPNNGLYQYAYNAGSYLQSVTYPDGAVRQYVYNEPTLTQGANLPGVLTGIVDENNVRYANFGYNPNALAIFTEHAGGTDRYSVIYATPPSEVLEVVNNGAGVPSSYRKYTQPPSGVQITDGLGQTRNYGFTSVAGLPRATGADHTNSGLCSAVPLSRTFDANGNVSASTDFNNVTSNFTYDLTRNLQTSRTEAAGTPKARTITTQWHATFGGPIQINEPGKRITMSYDSGGNAQAVTVTDTVTTASRTWSYNYNSYDQLTSLNGPRNDVIDVTNYTYYSCTTGYQCGQVQTITNALGQVTTFNTYNAHGQPLTITDSNGVVTTLTYDARARVLSRTTTGETMSFEYWQTGLLKKTTLPEGSFISYTYDAAHRLIGVTDNAGNRVVYTLDAMGNRTREDGYDPSNTLTTTRSRVFNSLSRLSQEIAAAGTPAVTTSLAYDNNGNQTTLSAPLGRTSTNQYDELNRIKQVTDPMNGVTVYGYNALDQLISVTDPKNLATTYAYNALGDLLTQMSPDTGPTTHTFDSAGNLKTSIDARNKMATYNYDVANRVTQVAYGDQTINYNYDAGANGKGRLTSASDTAHSMSWTYDGQGRVLSKTQIASGIAKTVSYSYSSGQLTSMTTPSGQTITYSYTAGKLTGMAVNGTTLLSSVLYEPFSGTRGWTWGNGTLAVRAYDLDGKLTQLDSAGLSTYDYDNAFRITGVTDTVNAANSWNYGYDNLDRLTTATNASLTQGYSFDADGNRLTQTGTTNTTFNYPTTSNKLSSTSGSLTKTYAYDLAGNTTSDGAITYIYNNRGRMTQANTTSYVYNVLGQRIKKSNATVTTYFIYDEAGHTLSEHDISGGLIQETIWLGDIPVATLRPDGSGGVTLFYVHTDHLNTPRRITRPSDNQIVWRWDSDPFGTSAANEDPDSDSNLFAYNLRFPGQYYDAESGLLYNMNRYYSAEIGRYTTSDPIGLEGGLNTYAYAEGDPISNIDPFGLWVKRCSRKLGGRDKPPVRSRTPFRHDYLNVSGSILSFQAGDSMAWSQGRIDDNEDQDKACTMVCDDDKFDAYVLAAADEIGAPKYCVIAYPGTLPHLAGARNCQTWADDVLKRAKEKYLKAESCPKCFK